MEPHADTPVEYTVLMEATTMEDTLRRMARDIVAGNPEVSSLVMLGILRRGVPIAERLSAYIGEMTGVLPPVGALATTLYRDDVGRNLAAASHKGETYFDFNVDDHTVLLVDDVLAAGRTIRAAMDEVMDYGRPARIQLACLLDRGRRELPIQAEYLGWPVATKPSDWVSVHLSELDDEDVVLLERHPESDAGEDAEATGEKE